MYKDVFAGLAHDEKFDFDVYKNDPAIGNTLTIIIRKESPFMDSDSIYWDLVGGGFLTRYKGDGFAEYLQEKINKLPDSIEYVLFARES